MKTESAMRTPATFFRNALLILFLFQSTLAFAQGSKLIKARNLLEQGDLIQAKEEIDSAIGEERNARKAKTWFYRGRIHYQLLRSGDEEFQEYAASREGELSLAGVESYLKAMELDKRGRYEKEIRNELPILKSALLNHGVNAFNRREYDKAYESFNNAIKAGELLEGAPADTLAYFNAGLAARQLGKNKAAAEHFRTSIELDNQESKSYFLLSRSLKEQGKMDEAFEVVQEGREAHPDMRKLVLEELDHYIRREDFREARKKLEKAIEDHPENSVLHFSLGTTYDHLYQGSDSLPEEVGGKDPELFQKAKKHYERSIELDSSFHSAYYSLGALFYNRGADILNSANTLKDQAKYESEIDKAEKDMERARPYLEKALEIEPQDRQTLISLRNLYSRIDEEEKAEKLQKQLEN